MGLFKKKINVPQGTQIEVTAVKTWRVDWSVWRGYSEPKKTLYEVFFTLEEANHFFEQLIAAKKLLRDGNIDIGAPHEN